MEGLQCRRRQTLQVYRRKPTAHRLKIVEDFSSAAPGTARKTQSTTIKKGLFHCLEVICVLSFDEEELMQHHMSVGKHTRVLEHESSYDRIKKEWAMTVSDMYQQPSTTSTLAESSASKVTSSVTIESEETGWALKKAKQHMQTSERVKAYLTDLFNKGVKTNQKADPTNVAHKMMHSRNEDGTLMFQPKEWKTAKQIASFFSHLSKEERAVKCYCKRCGERDK